MGQESSMTTAPFRPERYARDPPSTVWIASPACKQGVGKPQPLSLRRTSRALCAACAFNLLVFGWCEAQSGSKPDQHSPHGSGAQAAATKPVPAARLVRPDGTVSSDNVKLRPDAIPIQHNDSLDQVLKRSNLSPDPTTVDAVRKANPSLDLDQLHKHAGEHIYVPKVSGKAQPGGDRLQIQDPDLARVQLRQDRKELDHI